MIKTGKLLNRNIDVVISSMEQPLGVNIGNSLEVIESIEFLKGNYHQYLYEITLALATKTLMNCNIAKTQQEAKELFDKTIEDKSALNKFKEIIIAQGGNEEVINNYSLLKIGQNSVEIKSQNTGYISKLVALDVAHSAKLLGAGRDKKSDSINFGAGISLRKKIGDYIKENETIMELFYDEITENKLNDAIKIAKNSFEISSEKIDKPSLIY